uniref:RNase H type-1 domain-containing protein n=1 Tax=Quercus lobata TaxID=97700 RepID=A0A7N2KZD1_QUELO
MDNVLTPEPSLPVWFPTPLGWNKVNVDAALSSSKSALAAVARDHRGDAKGCFDTLASTDLLPDWSICTVINDIRSLVASLPFFKFCGAQRSCNSAAKFALSSCQSFCFNNGNLPLYIESVFEVDCQAYSFVSV